MWNRHYNWDRDNKYLLYLVISFQLSIAYCYGLQWELNLSYSSKNTTLTAVVNSRVLCATDGYLTFAICLKPRSQWLIKQISKNRKPPPWQKEQIIHKKHSSSMWFFFTTFLRVRQRETFSTILERHYEMDLTGLRQEFCENVIAVELRNNTR